MEATTLVGAMNVIDRDKTASLWHLRLFHVSEKGLNALEKKGCFSTTKLGKLEFCEDCVYGKAIKNKFSKALHKTGRVLDYIHSDLWGPARTNLHGGNRYYMSIIDDYSRSAWVYILKKKNDAFESFKNWKIKVENQTGRKVKVLRTDNGLEYCSDIFTYF